MSDAVINGPRRTLMADSDRQGMTTMSQAIVSLALLASAGAATPAQLKSVQLDYPATALRTRSEGVVAFEVKLAKNGKVTGCRVTQTSDHADLDQQTCSQLRKTAQFRPAMDVTGKPAPSIYAGRLRWKLPSSTPEAAPAVAPQ